VLTHKFFHFGSCVAIVCILKLLPLVDSWQQLRGSFSLLWGVGLAVGRSIYHPADVVRTRDYITGSQYDEVALHADSWRIRLHFSVACKKAALCNRNVHFLFQSRRKPIAAFGQHKDMCRQTDLQQQNIWVAIYGLFKHKFIGLPLPGP